MFLLLMELVTVATTMERTVRSHNKRRHQQNASKKNTYDRESFPEPTFEEIQLLLKVFSSFIINHLCFNFIFIIFVIRSTFDAKENKHQDFDISSLSRLVSHF